MRGTGPAPPQPQCSLPSGEKAAARPSCRGLALTASMRPAVPQPRARVPLLARASLQSGECDLKPPPDAACSSPRTGLPIFLGHGLPSGELPGCVGAGAALGAGGEGPAEGGRHLVEELPGQGPGGRTEGDGWGQKQGRGPDIGPVCFLAGTDTSHRPRKQGQTSPKGRSRLGGQTPHPPGSLPVFPPALPTAPAPCPQSWPQPPPHG